MEITSVNNELVKETVKLQQKKYRENKFLLEGFKAVEEAHLSGLKFERAFVEKNKRGKYLFLKCEVIETNEAVLKKISTTNTPPATDDWIMKSKLGDKRYYGSYVGTGANQAVLELQFPF